MKLEDGLVRKAAVAYEAFLSKNSAEFEAMELWESAPLSQEIEPVKLKG